MTTYSLLHLPPAALLEVYGRPFLAVEDVEIESSPWLDVSTESIVKEAREDPRRFWTENDIGRILVDVLLQNEFDGGGSCQLEFVKEWLVRLLDVARQILPPERRRF